MIALTPRAAVLAHHAGAACSSRWEARLAGGSLERLVSLTLSRKLGPLGDSYIGPGERRRMLQSAGVPGVLYANPATEAIFSSSAESLGKGGIIGQIAEIRPFAKGANHIIVGGNPPGGPSDAVVIPPISADPYLTGIPAQVMASNPNAASGGGYGPVGNGLVYPRAAAPAAPASITESPYFPYAVLGTGVVLVFSLFSKKRKRR